MSDTNVVRQLPLALLCAFVPLAPAMAAEGSEERIEEIVVTAEMFRGRESTVAPVLTYDLDYFQQLEPISVGDMLKRVPGVAFTSDIGEYDAPQLRGLATQYTQILINGRRIPGAGENRSVFVDRIPAEIVDHIEIIRSPTPDLDAQGIAGSLNIVLKDGSSLEGGDLRLSGIYYTEEDSAARGAVTASYGGRFDGGSYFLVANVQERYAPKAKSTVILDDERALDGTLSESDVRDSTDTSLSGNVTFELAPGSTLGFEGSYLETDRDEDELSTAFDADGVFDEQEFEHEDITQASWWTQTFYERDFDDATLSLDVSFSRFDNEIRNFAGPVADGVELIEETETIDTVDDEVKLGASIAWNASDAHLIKTGVDLQRKERDAEQRIFELDEGAFEEETLGSGVYTVREDRVDLFVMDTWTLTERAEVQYGARGEYTELDLDGSDGSTTGDELEINPSAHLVFQATPASQFRVSYARTVRRPSFDQLVPFTNEDSPSDDQTTIGNPDLAVETSNGLDVGYEYRFQGQHGILGLNLFYRDIQDVIELVEIAPDLFTPDNIDDGTVWGAEFDMSVPLDFLGAPRVAAYANATWLDSEITDPFTGEERQFNLQPEYIYNVGFFHDVSNAGVTYGASYQKQGDADLSEADGFRTLSYDGNLEVFIEKRLPRDITVRLVGRNLLDAQKTEAITAFEGLPARQAGVIDEFERESEETGPIYSLTLRIPFAR